MKCLFYLQVLHPKIRVIDLSECDISDRCLESIAVMCPNLRKIDLNSAKQNRITISSRGISSVLLFIVMEYVCLRHLVKTIDLLFRSDLHSRTLSTSTSSLSPSMSSVDRRSHSQTFRMLLEP